MESVGGLFCTSSSPSHGSTSTPRGELPTDHHQCPHLIAPTTSEPSITISSSEFRALVHTFQTLTITHSALFQQMVEMCAHQDQQIAILRQIQQHLGLLRSLSLTFPTLHQQRSGFHHLRMSLP
ncbi:hypothetical protein AAG906_018328 [Vitis piasezkii]